MLLEDNMEVNKLLKFDIIERYPLDDSILNRPFLSLVSINANNTIGTIYSTNDVDLMNKTIKLNNLMTGEYLVVSYDVFIRNFVNGNIDDDSLDHIIRDRNLNYILEGD